MIPPALRWFIDLSTGYPAPEFAKALGQDLANVLARANLRVEVSRVFRRGKHMNNLPLILAWLQSDIQAAIDAKNDDRTRDVWVKSTKAIKLIIAGAPASEAWGMGKQRGNDLGLSKTLDASALVLYLTQNTDLNYTQNQALEAAAALFGIRSDTIRQYESSIEIDADPASIYFSLIKYGLLETADRYFDVDELRESLML